jgi:nucleolar protein 9
MEEDNDGKDRKPRGPPPVSAAEKAEKLHASLLVQAMCVDVVEVRAC